MLILLLIITLVLTRIVEFYFFMKKVTEVCYKYDWKHVNNNDLLVLEIIKKGYYLKSKWSAYNFLFLKGPNPLAMFFSFKLLKIENIYNEESIAKLKEYEII